MILRKKSTVDWMMVNVIVWRFRQESDATRQKNNTHSFMRQTDLRFAFIYKQIRNSLMAQTELMN
jgi:hypothetical protein